MVDIDKKESDFINSIKFICILTIVMVHCSFHNTPALVPLLKHEEIHNLSVLHYCLHFGEVALRIFFILSGYLFFRKANLASFNWKIDYLFKLKNRIKGLLILYIVWNIVGLVRLYFLNNTYPTDILSLLNGFNPFSQGGYYGRGLWFIETLLVFSLLAPCYYFIVRCLKHLTPVICLLFSFTDIKIEYLYFNVYLLLGCYLACMGIKLTDIAKLLNWKICIALVLLIQIGIRSQLINLPVACDMSVLIFLSAFWGLLYNHPIPTKLAESSIFIYLAHFFIVAVPKRIFVDILPDNLFGYVSNLILNCTISSCICILVYIYIIKKFDILNLLFAGGRSSAKKSKLSTFDIEKQVTKI